MTKLRLILLLLFFTTEIKAKENKTISVTIVPLWGSEKLNLNKIYNDLNSPKINIKTLKFYITSFTTLKKDKLVYSEKNSFHLIDLANKSSLTWNVIKGSKKQFDEINFQLGVDSLTNESGARGGDLDPTKGMYWSWQSGYINFKMEGNLEENGKKTNFDYHLGGYQNRFNSIQTIKLKVKYTNVIQIGFDLKAFITGINLKANPKVMSPSVKSVELSKLISQCFRIING